MFNDDVNDGNMAFVFITVISLLSIASFQIPHHRTEKLKSVNEKSRFQFFFKCDTIALWSANTYFV